MRVLPCLESLGAGLLSISKGGLRCVALSFVRGRTGYGGPYTTDQQTRQGLASSFPKNTSSRPFTGTKGETTPLSAGPLGSYAVCNGATSRNDPHLQAGAPLHDLSARERAEEWHGCSPPHHSGQHTDQIPSISCA